MRGFCLPVVKGAVERASAFFLLEPGFDRGLGRAVDGAGGGLRRQVRAGEGSEPLDGGGASSAPEESRTPTQSRGKVLLRFRLRLSWKFSASEREVTSRVEYSRVVCDSPYGSLPRSLSFPFCGFLRPFRLGLGDSSDAGFGLRLVAASALSLPTRGLLAFWGLASAKLLSTGHKVGVQSSTLETSDASTAS